MKDLICVTAVTIRKIKRHPEEFLSSLLFLSAEASLVPAFIKIQFKLSQKEEDLTEEKKKKSKNSWKCFNISAFRPTGYLCIMFTHPTLQCALQTPCACG